MIVDRRKISNSTGRRTAPDGSKVDRRKTARFLVSVPIDVTWRNGEGIPVLVNAVAKQVNANGGFLEMTIHPSVGSRITLTNFLSAETAEARVLATPSSREGVSHGIIVELITPSESFWGVNLQVKKTSVELQKLEKALQSEGIDFRLLNEFRDTVETLRTTAVAVQQLREFQLRGKDDGEIVSMLVTGRVRRATNLFHELIADLDAGKLDTTIKGIDELYDSLELACDRLRHLVKSRRPDRYVTTRT
jgi:hypothetical protein